MNTASLFRPEALAAERERAWGRVLALHDPGAGWLALLALVSAIALVAFACMAPVTRKASVEGYLVPDQGLLRVTAPEAGIIIEKRFEDGQQVRKGQVLFVLSGERATREHPESRASVIRLMQERRASAQIELQRQSDLDAQARQGIAMRIKGLQDELAVLAREGLALERRIEAAREQRDRINHLAGNGFVSVQQQAQAENEVQEHLGRRHALERQRVALQRDLDAARRELASSGPGAANRREALRRQISEIEQELTEAESRRSLQVLAPADGIASAALLKPGQSTAAGAPLVSIEPAGAHLRAELLAPTRTAGFVQPGMPVRLRHAAFPHARFGTHGGQVIEVSRSVIQPGDASLPVHVKEAVYRITVALDSQQVQAYGQAHALKAGMLLDADIVLEQGKVIDWVLDPMRALAGRL